MIGFIYIVSSVFQLELPRTPEGRTTTFVGGTCSRFFQLGWFFNEFLCPNLVHCFSLHSRIDVLIFLYLFHLA